MDKKVLKARENAIREVLSLRELLDAEIIGIGTGSTMTLLINNMPKHLITSKLFVASSIDTVMKLKMRGARVLDLNSIDEIDVYIDSADFYDKNKNLIKGGGGALSLEKILAFYSKTFIVVVDCFKERENLLNEKIPIEVRRDSITLVKKYLEKELGLRTEVRVGSGKKGPVISDSSGALIDLKAGEWMWSIEKLDEELHKIPGVIETGLFINMTDKLVIGRERRVDVL